MIYTVDSVKIFLNVHDMHCRGFIDSDLSFFADRLINADRIPESFDIINMLTYIKKTLVTPRVDKLRGRSNDPRDVPPQDVRKYRLMAEMLLQKKAPVLVVK